MGRTVSGSGLAKCAVVLSLGAAAVPGCTSLDCALPECDVRRASCQRQVMRATACLRDVPAISVAVEVRRRDELITEAVEEANGADPAAWREMQAALALMDLEPAAVSAEEIAADAASTIGGYYMSEDDRIVLVDDGGELDSLYATALLAHEFSHALQARVAPFQPSFSSLDAAIASAAIREGDAVWTDDRLFALGAGRHPSDIDWDGIYGPWAASTLLAYHVEPSRFRFARRYFAYPFGSIRVAAEHASGGQAAVDAMIATPPLSMYEVVTPTGFDRAAAIAALDERVVPALDAELLRVTGVGWWILWEGSRLGERLRTLGTWDSLELAPEADALSLWARSDTRVPLAALRLRFSDAAQAQRVASAFAFDTDVIATADGQEASLLFVRDPAWNAELRAIPPSWQAQPSEDEAPEEDASLGTHAFRCMAPGLKSF